jgi:Fe-S cluster assembly protein SufD
MSAAAHNINLAQLPSRRTEGWRWSDLRTAVGGLELDLRSRGDTVALAAPHPDRRLGRMPILSPVVSFAAGKDVLVYDVEAGLDRTLRFDLEAFVGAGGHTVVVNVAEGGSLTLIETYVGERQALGSLELVVNAARGARVVRLATVRDSDGAVLLSHARIRLEQGATFRQFVLAEGAKLARVETHVDVAGEGAHVELNGVYMVSGGRHADLTSVIAHEVAGATTNQLIKGVAAKGGRGVFQGKIEVARHAQKTDARQRHDGLMLEEGAEIFAKPELMIFADDVSCAHGNTVGALDETALFYMRSRGISEAAARALLVEAFLAEAVSEALPESARAESLERIRAWLGGVR